MTMAQATLSQVRKAYEQLVLSILNELRKTIEDLQRERKELEYSLKAVLEKIHDEKLQEIFNNLSEEKKIEHRAKVENFKKLRSTGIAVSRQDEKTAHTILREISQNIVVLESMVTTLTGIMRESKNLYHLDTNALYQGILGVHESLKKREKVILQEIEPHVTSFFNYLEQAKIELLAQVNS